MASPSKRITEARNQALITTAQTLKGSLSTEQLMDLAQGSKRSIMSALSLNDAPAVNLHAAEAEVQKQMAEVAAYTIGLMVPAAFTCGYDLLRQALVDGDAAAVKKWSEILAQTPFDPTEKHASRDEYLLSIAKTPEQVDVLLATFDSLKAFLQKEPRVVIFALSTINYSAWSVPAITHLVKDLGASLQVLEGSNGCGNTALLQTVLYSSNYMDAETFGAFVTLLKSQLETPSPDGWTPLFHAVQKQELAKIKILVEAGAKLDHEAPDGEAIFKLAIRRCQFDIFEYLCDAAKDQAKVQLAKICAYHYIMDMGIEELRWYEKLVAVGVDVEIKKDDRSALDAASVSRQFLVRFLVEQANAKVEGSFALVSCSDSDLDLLLSKGADVNAVRPSDGFTPLLYRLDNGRFESARLLLDKGAKWDARTKEDVGGRNALHYLAVNSNSPTDLILLALEKKVDPTVTDSASQRTAFAMYLDAARSDVAVIDAFITAGVTMQQKNSSGAFVNAYALINQSDLFTPEQFQKWLPLSSIAGMLDDNGDTPVHVLCQSAAGKGWDDKRLALLKEFLAQKPVLHKPSSISIVDQLTTSISEQSRIAMDLILSAMTEAEQKEFWNNDVKRLNEDANPRSQLQYLAWRGTSVEDQYNLLFKEVLTKHLNGIDINHANPKTGRTALHNAFFGGNPGGAIVLLENGGSSLNVNATDKNGATPADMCNDMAIMRTLLDKGATVTVNCLSHNTSNEVFEAIKDKIAAFDFANFKPTGDYNPATFLATIADRTGFMDLIYPGYVKAINSGAIDFNAIDGGGRSALVYLGYRGTNEGDCWNLFLEKLLQDCAAKIKYDMVDTSNNENCILSSLRGNNPGGYAVLLRVPQVKAIINEIVPATGRAVIHWVIAERYYDTDMLRKVVADGADVNKKDGQGRTPLEIARNAGADSMAAALVELGAK